MPDSRSSFRRKVSLKDVVEISGNNVCILYFFSWCVFHWSSGERTAQEIISVNEKQRLTSEEEEESSAPDKWRADRCCYKNRAAAIPKPNIRIEFRTESSLWTQRKSAECKWRRRRGWCRKRWPKWRWWWRGKWWRSKQDDDDEEDEDVDSDAWWRPVSRNRRSKKTSPKKTTAKKRFPLTPPRSGERPASGASAVSLRPRRVHKLWQWLHWLLQGWLHWWLH